MPRFINSIWQTKFFALFLLLLVLAAVFFSYLPGASGSFLFDDRINITQNKLLEIDTLDFDSLVQAAFSGHAGPLKRPVAMLSFAVNHYVSGEHTAYGTKLTNILIHLINGILVFVLGSIVIKRLGTNPHLYPDNRLNDRKTTYLALFVTALWLSHPIQLTSVLYVVQRMTSLAVTFVLLSLISYLFARQYWSRATPTKAIAWTTVFCLSFTLGILTKEIAALVPVYAVLLEMSLYPESRLMQLFRGLWKEFRTPILVAGIAGSVILSYIAFIYVNPGYAGRTFTLNERLMTEARVVFYYLSLMAVPRLDALALYHDDIPISTGLVSPWTTLPSVVGILLLLGFSLFSKKKLPFASLGILLFLSSHLLESTIFPLEIAHEHRNYFGLFGFALILVEAAIKSLDHYRPVIIAPVLLLLVTACLLVTHTRAIHWGSAAKLFYYESRHHPESAIAHLEWGGILMLKREVDQAEKAFVRAWELQPREPSHLMWVQIMLAQNGMAPKHKYDREITDALIKYYPSPTTQTTLESAAGCLVTNCQKLGPSFLLWTNALLKRKSGNRRDAQYKHYLGIYYTSTGNFPKAVDAYTEAYNMDKTRASSLVNLTWVFIRLGQLPAARHTFSLLEKMGKNHTLAYTAAISELDRKLSHLEQSQGP